MRQYNVGGPFERIAIDITIPYPEPDLVTMDYFMKWVEVYAISNKEATTAAEGYGKGSDKSFWSDIKTVLGAMP